MTFRAAVSAEAPISIVRIHGEACLICGGPASTLAAAGDLQTLGGNRQPITWPVVACAAHTEDVAAILRETEQHPVIIQMYLDRLAAALQERGIAVVVRSPGLTASNPAANPKDPRGTMLSPGLSQKVTLHQDQGRGLVWCWVWPALRSAERGMPMPDPEIEPICPAADIEQVATKLAGVLRLSEQSATER